ncbi:MAG: hypothetical protein KME54_12595 [Tolypothrix brevis GSE-NOS-MK-07-07A]|jgi:hypothetical protein|nr:hypothetical protein [Tolypothrix brevis GSE-NOS-MK-07-07A]
MDIGHLPKNILDKICNLGGTEKQLRCKECKKITKQVSITYGEMFPDDDSIPGHILLAVNNYNPGVTLTLGIPFVCTECGKMKLDGGLISTVMNKHTRAY